MTSALLIVAAHTPTIIVHLLILFLVPKSFILLYVTSDQAYTDEASLYML